MTLKLRAPVPFPANVTASGGLGIDKQNGVWDVHPEFSALANVTTLASPAEKQIWVYDPITGEYSVLTLTALAGSLFTSTSTTSVAIGANPVTIATQDGRLYQIGSFVIASSAANPANYMILQVTAYANGSLTGSLISSGGSGTHADWNINAGGTDGASAQTSAAAASASATAAAGSASTASTAATNAGTSATNAASSASTASTQAGIATTQASAAATSATSAAGSATTATTQATTATTQATNAAASAALAAATAGFRYIWSTNTTASDPGTGTIKGNNATVSAITAIYISETDVDSNALAAIISDWGVSTSVNKAVLRIVKTSAPGTVWAQFYVTAAVSDSGAWDSLTVTYKDGSGTLSNLDAVTISAQLIGDKGATGPGGAVSVSGTPTVNQFAAWVDATTVKGVSVTGLVKGNGASAPTAAVSGTDYAPATSGSSILKGNGLGGFSNASAGTDFQAADAQLFSNIPQNSKSAAYTLVATDAQKQIFHPAADTTARIWTIPANASVPLPIGTAITFINEGSAGVITIAITSDTLVLAGSGSVGSRTLAANGMATVVKITSTKWIISGLGLS